MKVTAKKNSFILIPILLLFTIVIIAQNNNVDRISEIHHEVQDDAYIYVSRSSMQKNAAYSTRSSNFFTTQVNIDSGGNNIVGDAANEPSIAVDPTNPNRMVIGWRQFDTITSNFRQAGYGYSTDGGLTWTFPSVIDPGLFRSDPVLDFDVDGNFYYNSLRSGFLCDVFKIDDDGVTWGSAVPAQGGDKQWMRIDRTNGIGAGHNYSNWNVSFSTCSPGDFTRSTNDATSFENCVAVTDSPRWGTLAVDADGMLYIVGTSGTTGGIIVIKSSTAKDASIPVSWDTVSNVDLEGFQNAGIPVNPQGLLGQLWIDVDVSGGSGHGNVYVLASVSRNSNSDPGDVMFAKSTDGGTTFSAPIRINTDVGTTAVQWFGTMSVAPNGRIDVVWLDTRDAPTGTFMSSLYYSFSEDKGDTWSVNEELSVAFDPTIGYPQQNKMGDYFDMVSDNDGAHLAWANTINGGQDVYYANITPTATVSVNENVLNNFRFKSYPNPFKDEINIEFYLENEELVKIEVFNLLGQKMKTLLDGETIGKHSLKWNGTNEFEQKLGSGMYLISIQTESFTTKKSILITVVR